MGLFTTAPVSLIPSAQRSAGSVKSHASRLLGDSRTVKDAAAQQLFQSVGAAAQSVQEQIDQIFAVLRADIPQPATYGITDPSGNLIAWIGYNTVANVVYQGGWFKQLYVGGTDAAHAVLVSDINGNVTITNASITVSGGGVTVTIEPGFVPIFVLSANNQIIINFNDIRVLNTTMLTGVVIHDSGIIDVNGLPGITQVVALAKLTALGANGSLTVTGGIPTAYVAPT